MTKSCRELKALEAVKALEALEVNMVVNAV